MAREQSLFKTVKRVAMKSGDFVESGVEVLVEELNTAKTINKIENVADKQATKISAIKDIGEPLVALMKKKEEGTLNPLEELELEVLQEGLDIVKNIDIR